MRQRCRDSNSAAWKNYGGRGISVCERWDSFDLFAADVGEPPDDSFTLDRIDNDKGYEPGNVRWATRKEQYANSRRGRRSAA